MEFCWLFVAVEQHPVYHLVALSIQDTHQAVCCLHMLSKSLLTNGVTGISYLHSFIVEDITHCETMLVGLYL